jgi:hypothetical protein
VGYNDKSLSELISYLKELMQIFVMQYPDFLMVHLQKMIAGLLISARATATLLLTQKVLGFVIHTVRKTKIR